jgi:hypothetical protein
MSDIGQIALSIAGLGILIFVVFILMVNGLDGLNARVKKLEAARLSDKHDAWDEGFSARSQEDADQRLDPSHPITRTNPYGAKR